MRKINCTIWIDFSTPEKASTMDQSIMGTMQSWAHNSILQFTGRNNQHLLWCWRRFVVIGLYKLWIMFGNGIMVRSFDIHVQYMYIYDRTLVFSCVSCVIHKKTMMQLFSEGAILMFSKILCHQSYYDFKGEALHPQL